MIGLAASITVAAMVGPIGPGASTESAMRISRPASGVSELVVLTRSGATEFDRSRLIEVPDSAVAGGGGVTVVGDTGCESVGHTTTEMVGDLQTGLVTEQLFRAFGYDRDHFGYSYTDYPRNYRRGGVGGFGGNGGQPEQPAIDPRVLDLLRNLAPIEAKYPVAIPGR